MEFCLITSTEGRWIFPKGTGKADKNYWKTAIREAVQEAGLRGNLLCRPLGLYEMVKDEKIYTLCLSSDGSDSVRRAVGIVTSSPGTCTSLSNAPCDSGRRLLISDAR